MIENTGYKKGNKKLNKKALIFILSYIKRYLYLIIPGVIALITVDFIQLVIPKIIQGIIDTISMEYFSLNTIVKRSILIVGLSFMMVIIRFIWRILIIGSARRIEKDLRNDMFSHLIKIDMQFFLNTSTGKLMALMINDVNAIRMAAGPTLIAITDVFFMGILTLFFMAKINTLLTLYVILPLPLIVVLMVKFAPEIVQRYKRVQEAFSNISKQAQESFSGIRVVKGYNMHKYEIGEFKGRADDYIRYNMDFVKIWGFFFPILSLVTSVSLVSLLFFGGKKVMIGTISFGEFLSFSMYINLLIWPVTAIGWVFSLLQRGIASAIRVMELFSKTPEKDYLLYKDRPLKKIKPVRFKGKISYQNVYLRFSDSRDYLLKDINFTVEPGEVLGVTGKPGSGKTLMLSLIFKLLPLTDGKIELDDVNIDSIPAFLIRQNIGYVPQDGFLFSDPILNNILFSCAECSMFDAEKAAKVAEIYDEIMSFKDGFYTQIGERGVSLSGGQRQRIAIARAVVKNPDILIMDDALSQVDTQKEVKIINNILQIFEGKTVILVSHKISTLKSCDKILIIDHGSIIDEGTHEDLISRNHYYRSINEIQGENKFIGL